MASKRALLMQALPVIIAVASLGVSLAIFFALRREQTTGFQQLFAEQTARRAKAVEKIFTSQRDVALIVASLFDMPAEPTPPEKYKEYLSVVPRDYPMLDAARVAIIDSPEERARFENLKGRSVVYQSNTSRPAKGSSVYFPVLDTTEPKFDAVDFSDLCSVGRAFRAAWERGGIHDSLSWTPIMDGEVLSASMAPIYDTIARPAWATDGEAHKRAVNGIVAVVTKLSAALPLVLSRYEPLPMRVQMWVPSGLVDLASVSQAETLIGQTGPETGLADEYTHEVMIQGSGAPLRMSFTPTVKHVHKHTWLYSVAVVPIGVLLFGCLAAAFVWYYARQTNLFQGEKRKVEAALASRNKFLAYICHELRNPLNATKGYIEWLRETALSHEQAQYVDGLATGLEHMLRITNDTLDLGKLEAGLAEILRERFDLCELMVNSIKIFEPVVISKRLSLKAKASANMPCFVYGDSLRLSQIVHNLLSNAVRATVAGGITLRIHFQLSADGSDDCSSDNLFSGPIGTVQHGTLKQWEGEEGEEGKTSRHPAVLRVSVSDTGPGIPTEALPHLFLEYYSQPNPSVGSSTRGTGTGLGLFFVKAILKCWGGDITVRSQVGVGSCFSVRVPVLVGAQEQVHCNRVDECIRNATSFAINLPVLSHSTSNVVVLSSPSHGASLPPLVPPMQQPLLPVQMPPMPSIGMPRAGEAEQPPLKLIRPPSQPTLLSSGAGNDMAGSGDSTGGLSRTLRTSSGLSLSPVPLLPASSNPSSSPSLFESKGPPRQPPWQQQCTVSRPRPSTLPIPRSRSSSSASSLSSACSARSDGTRRGRNEALLAGGEGWSERAVEPTPNPMSSSTGSIVSGGSGVGSGSGSNVDMAGFTVLAVDDSDVNLKIISRKIKKLNGDMLTASNGLQALEVYQANMDRLDLIIMDLQMPVMDGHTATQQLRALGCMVPIVALTGSVTGDDRRRCTESGMDGFLEKPLQDMALLEVLRKHVTQRTRLSNPVSNPP